MTNAFSVAILFLSLAGAQASAVTKTGQCRNLNRGLFAHYHEAKEYRGMPIFEMGVRDATDLENAMEFANLSVIGGSQKEVGVWQKRAPKSNPYDYVGHGISGIQLLDLAGPNPRVSAFAGVVREIVVLQDDVGGKGAFYVIAFRGHTDLVSIMSQVMYESVDTLRPEPPLPGKE